MNKTIISLFLLGLLLGFSSSLEARDYVPVKTLEEHVPDSLPGKFKRTDYKRGYKFGCPRVSAYYKNDNDEAISLKIANAETPAERFATRIRITGREVEEGTFQEKQHEGFLCFEKEGKQNELVIFLRKDLGVRLSSWDVKLSDLYSAADQLELKTFAEQAGGAEKVKPDDLFSDPSFLKEFVPKTLTGLKQSNTSIRIDDGNPMAKAMYGKKKNKIQLMIMGGTQYKSPYMNFIHTQISLGNTKRKIHKGRTVMEGERRGNTALWIPLSDYTQFVALSGIGGVKKNQLYKALDELELDKLEKHAPSIPKQRSRRITLQKVNFQLNFPSDWFLLNLSKGRNEIPGVALSLFPISARSLKSSDKLALKDHAIVLMTVLSDNGDKQKHPIKLLSSERIKKQIPLNKPSITSEPQKVEIEEGTGATVTYTGKDRDGNTIQNHHLLFRKQGTLVHVQSLLPQEAGEEVMKDIQRIKDEIKILSRLK